jgi:hypothetical protein
MDANLLVHKREAQPFTRFLEDNDFEVTQVTENVLQASRLNEQSIFINHKDGGLYFEVDLGSVSAINEPEILYALLDLNTEILPVSVGIDSSHADDPRLVLVESREADNLDENELLSVISALEIGVEKVMAKLSQHIQEGA